MRSSYLYINYLIVWPLFGILIAKYMYLFIQMLVDGLTMYKIHVLVHSDATGWLNYVQKCMLIYFTRIYILGLRYRNIYWRKWIQVSFQAIFFKVCKMYMKCKKKPFIINIVNILHRQNIRWFFELLKMFLTGYQKLYFTVFIHQCFDVVFLIYFTIHQHLLNFKRDINTK